MIDDSAGDDTLPKNLLTSRDIASLPYLSLLARLSESNRPPGGIDTIRRIVLNCHLRPGRLVLHPGCNAGFVSRTIARHAGCQVLGVDLHEEMVLAARARAEHEGLAGLVTYQQGDARHLSLDRPVDVVVSDGALAFVEGHREALAQWIDVVVPHGFLADAEFYYRDPPPDALLRELSDAIDVQVQPYERAYWDELFTHDLLEPYYVHRSSAVARTVSEIEAYCRRLVAHVRPFWRPSAEAALLERLQALFTLFNRNLAHMDYVVHVHSRLPADAEPALFV